MTKTTNFQLNQWDASDYVRRTDFNEDNAKIESALSALSTASPVTTGTYTGTGTECTLELGFCPSLFVVWGLTIGEKQYTSDNMGAICFNGGQALSIRRSANYVAANLVTFTETGVTLPAAWPNQADGAYYYAAFR